MLGLPRLTKSGNRLNARIAQERVDPNMGSVLVGVAGRRRCAGRLRALSQFGDMKRSCANHLHCALERGGSIRSDV